MADNFRPYSKEMQLGKKKEKPKKQPFKQVPLVQKRPMKQKRDTPRVKHKERTKEASGYKRPSLYARGYFGKEYDTIFEQHGAVCGEKIFPTNHSDIPNCSGHLQAHHVKFKSGGGRGVWRNGRPLCEAHHTFAHSNRWYADKWREIHEEKYGEHFSKDEWDLYKENLIDEPTREKLEAFLRTEEKKTNWGF